MQLELHKPTMAIGYSLRMCAQNVIRPIQVEVNLYLGQTENGSRDVESAY